MLSPIPTDLEILIHWLCTAVPWSWSNYFVLFTVGETKTQNLGDLLRPTVHWRDWYWSWNSNTLATSWEELTHWKRPWCWEGLGAEAGDDRGWDGWMASPTRWTWVWVNSGSWWRTGRPGVLRFMGSQRVGHDWATELNWCLCRLSCSQGRAGDGPNASVCWAPQRGKRNTMCRD